MCAIINRLSVVKLKKKEKSFQKIVYGKEIGNKNVKFYEKTLDEKEIQ